MINKTLNKLEMERIFLNLINGNYKRPTANIIINDERLNAFLLRSGTRQRWPLSPLLFNKVLETLLVRAIR